MVDRRVYARIMSIFFSKPTMYLWSLRCDAGSGTVPLYLIPFTETKQGELHDRVIWWASDYQACDRLQMNSRTGVRFGLDQISKLDSSLSVRGREICGFISEAMGIPVYYYLFRFHCRSMAKERERKCPGCGGHWLLEEQIHDFFDFKCDSCRILSNVAMGTY